MVASASCFKTSSKPLGNQASVLDPFNTLWQMFSNLLATLCKLPLDQLGCQRWLSTPLIICQMLANGFQLFDRAY